MPGLLGLDPDEYGITGYDRLGLLSSALVGMGAGLQRRRAPGVSLVPGGADPGTSGWGEAMEGGLRAWRAAQDDLRRRALIGSQLQTAALNRTRTQQEIDQQNDASRRRAALASALASGDPARVAAARADFDPAGAYAQEFGWRKPLGQIEQEQAAQRFTTDEGIRGAQGQRAMTPQDRADALWRSNLAVGQAQRSRAMTPADRADAEWRADMEVAQQQRARAMTPADRADAAFKSSIATMQAQQSRVKSPEEIRQEEDAARLAAGLKAPTNEQALAAGYYGRMMRADQILDEFSDKGLYGRGANAVLGNTPLIGNFLRNKDNQQIKQAQEDWVRAKLRKESGAVISEEEMAREIRTYFPQPGDSDAVVAQKAAARETARDAMKLTAGAAAGAIKPREIDAAPPPMKDNKIDGAALKKGKKYRIGDRIMTWTGMQFE